MSGALSGLRILDLTRILAGPYCTQMLGDMGAEVIKIEQPGRGDDTRKWGPPFLKDADGKDTGESAYYLCANRSKRSVSIDIASAEGQELIHSLIAKSDILIENFKTGGLKKYSLSYEQIKERHPHIIYCSITGFGQTGPLATEPGYDFIAQAMSGLMAATGEPDGPPMKAGVALGDVITGLHAAIDCLAALHSREKTGKGQHIDLALTDCTLASMVNIAQYYLTSGTNAPRLGNAHSTIVPYQAFASADGYIIVAVGNDSQFGRFCDLIGKTGWKTDPRFATNQGRVEHRDTLIPLIEKIMSQKSAAEWLCALRDIDVPCGPVNDMSQAFTEPQLIARNMEIEINHELSSNPVKLVGSPVKFSETPVAYKYPPPQCGQHTAEILQDVLGMTRDEVDGLSEKGVI